MPSSRARSFMSRANAPSLPAMPSASAIAASLPEWTIRPSSKSLTLIREWIAAYIVEPPDGAPPRRQAFSLMTNSSSGLTLPSAIWSNTMSAVISLAMLAGGTSWSAFFSNRIAPLSASIRTAVGTDVWKPPAGAAIPAPAGNRDTKATTAAARRRHRDSQSRPVACSLCRIARSTPAARWGVVRPPGRVPSPVKANGLARLPRQENVAVCLSCRRACKVSSLDRLSA